MPRTAPDTQAVKDSHPRRHDILDRKGKIVAEDLSEFETIRLLENWNRLFDSNHEDLYEVHYVNEERELVATRATRFIREKRYKYRTIL